MLVHPSIELAFARVGERIPPTAADAPKLYPKPLGEQASKG